MKPVRLERFSDKQLNSLSTAIRDLQAPLLDNPFINGQFLTQVVSGETTKKFSFTAATSYLLDHGLGRKIQGLIEISGYNTGAPPRIYIDPSTEDNTKQVRVTAQATGSCWIWVF